ncbi:hypothetical protein A359_00930 [secondary endosymbiont of Ctenarytaina eucalypti]|uniref:Uncharacterized protein n=1 Tax=secondary endosymbiont of Ctenarytaina eucalypti TaxID=1199245 RepID=J3TEY1_9ENTR|nr:hypothetical protein A359_00930 [secondary endosymbiont of Ctenarytaina eucalypti]
MLLAVLQYLYRKSLDAIILSLAYRQQKTASASTLLSRDRESRGLTGDANHYKWHQLTRYGHTLDTLMPEVFSDTESCVLSPPRHASMRGMVQALNEEGRHQQL